MGMGDCFEYGGASFKGREDSGMRNIFFRTQERRGKG